MSPELALFGHGAMSDLGPLCALVLLRHKFHCDGLIDRVQHGHRDKRLTMATVSLRRRVAMEFGMWRSVLSGGAAGSIIFGKARRLEVRGGTRF